MAEESDPIATSIDAFAVSRSRSRLAFERWSQEKKDLITAIVKHNSTPGKTPLSVHGALTFMRDRGHTLSEGGLRNFCREVLRVDWGAW